MSKTTAELLALPMEENDADAATIGEYLGALLDALWTQGEEFDSKKPFGNSDWKIDIEIALVQAGVIDGAFDVNGYYVWSDSKAANEVIRRCIRDVFSLKKAE